MPSQLAFPDNSEALLALRKAHSNSSLILIIRSIGCLVLTGDYTDCIVSFLDKVLCTGQVLAAASNVCFSALVRGPEMSSE